MKIPREFQDGVDAALAAGWTLDVTKGGHLRLKPPGGSIRDAGDRMITQLIFPASPSDHRSVKNFRADLRRCGIAV